MQQRGRTYLSREHWTLCLSKDALLESSVSFSETQSKLWETGYEVARGGKTVLTKQNDLVISSSKLVCASWRWWQDLAVSSVTGMNGPVVARHSAAVQQGLFNQLNDRQADGRRANHRHSALAAVIMPIQPDQWGHVTRAERERERVGEERRVEICECFHWLCLYFSSVYPTSICLHVSFFTIVSQSSHVYSSKSLVVIVLP